MGMTDAQFKSFIRLLLASLKDMLDEDNPGKKEAKTQALLDNLQKALEE